MTKEEIQKNSEHWYNKYKDAEKRITDLEKENAELKKLKRECETSLCRAEYQYNYEQLTKAKEIIKDLLRLPYANDWEVYGDVTSHLDKAEQFIKEIEK